MPILRNARHERFAQGVAEGKKLEDAYENAGFRGDRRNAFALRQKDDVSHRIAEILAVQDAEARRKIAIATEKAAISKADVLKMLVEDRELARSLNQLGPAVRAAELLGKEIGMFIERREQRNVDEFESLEDKELRDLVKRRAAEMAGVAEAEKRTKH